MTPLARPQLCGAHGAPGDGEAPRRAAASALGPDSESNVPGRGFLPLPPRASNLTRPGPRVRLHTCQVPAGARGCTWPSLPGSGHSLPSPAPQRRALLAQLLQAWLQHRAASLSLLSSARGSRFPLRPGSLTKASIWAGAASGPVTCSSCHTAQPLPSRTTGAASPVGYTTSRGAQQQKGPRTGRSPGSQRRSRSRLWACCTSITGAVSNVDAGVKSTVSSPRSKYVYFY